MKSNTSVVCLALFSPWSVCGWWWSGGGDDDNNEYMMMMKLSICYGLVAQYEVHHNCCLSRSVQPLLSGWLVVMMMVVMMITMNI